VENGTNGGKFAPGNKLALGHKGAGGRPRKELEIARDDLEVEYLAILRDHVAPEAWAGIIDKQVQRAQSGHLEAAKFLASYLIGQPRQSVEVKAQLTIDAVEIFAEMRKTLRGANGHRDMEPK